MATYVLKFGGSSFPTLESYRSVARYLVGRIRAGDRLVVVVSAPSGTSGRLLEAGLAVNPAMSPEVTDSLLATGEMSAAALMRSAIEAEGARATHLWGAQSGIVTDSRFTNATVLSVDPKPILRGAPIVVVAGGQGADADGRCTMLGRNSSDYTAALIAGALRAERCEIFSDVPGVYTADPYRVPEARLLAEIPYAAIIAMSRGGAKVLHHRAVLEAERAGVPIECRRLVDGDDTLGTTIGRGSWPGTVSSSTAFTVLRFKTDRLLDIGRLQVEDAGFVCLTVRHGGVNHLAVANENRGAEMVVRDLVGAEELKEVGLVTELRHDGSVEREICRRGDLEESVRSRHRGLYPEARAEDHDLVKSRSESSGLLIAS